MSDDLFLITDPKHKYVGRLAVLARSCPQCNSCLFRLTPPRGPHSYGIRCESCKRHCGWLNKAETADLNSYFADTGK